MRTGLLFKFIIAIFFSVAITACGLVRFEKREEWRNRAEAACMRQNLVPQTEFMQVSKPVGRGACGMNTPFKVFAFSQGHVRMKTTQTLNCMLIPAIEAWIRDTVQPAAQIYYNSRVVEMRAGSYSCRGRNNRRGAKLSEHSFGNAFDVHTFTLENGEVITVKGGWAGTDQERQFLREIFVGSCNYFTTVLGPGSDRYHWDHFHLDLARHDANWSRRYCRPVIKFEPRIPPRNTSMSPPPS